MDPILASFLPPRALWPERIYTLPEHATYPARLSSTEELIDRKSSGDRIGPEEVEEALAGHPAVADVGVIEVTDPVRGQRTRAYVTLRPGQAVADGLRRELIEFCRDKVALYKLPREGAFVPQLPRAPGPAGPGTGKLLRHVLREQAARG